MSSRDEYLQKFKTQLDEWNNDIDELQARARQVQSDAQTQYHEQIKALQEMRDDALSRYNEMQNATVEAWDALAEGAEKTWQTWIDTFDNARSKFKTRD